MPTKKDFINALALEATPKEIRNEFDDKPNFNKKQWLAELEEDTHEGVRSYYYYWRRIMKNFRGKEPKTFVSGNKIKRR